MLLVFSMVILYVRVVLASMKLLELVIELTTMDPSVRCGVMNVEEAGRVVAFV